MLADALNGVIRVHGDGSQTRSFTWVEDIVGGIIEVGIRDGLAGKSFNLGSLEEISMLDLAKRIQEFTSAEIEFSSGYLGDSLRRLPDLEGNDLIEWRANTTLDEGLSRLFTMLGG